MNDTNIGAMGQEPYNFNQHPTSGVDYRFVTIMIILVGLLLFSNFLYYSILDDALRQLFSASSSGGL